MIDTRERINELIDWLNYFTKFYDEGNPQVSDEEWDKHYFELVKLEKENPDLVRADSPTQRVNYDCVTQLKKVAHNHKMLSLDKTKEIEDVYKFSSKNPLIAMYKMDGLTISLNYVGGKLVSAETRGNGEIGELVTHNALVIKSIPKRIFCKEDITIDGEVICRTDDFLPFSEEYKNPRNFAAGSLRLLDNKECEKRKLTFVAWDIIKGSLCETLSDKLEYLSKLGFITVPYTYLGLGFTEDMLKEYIDAVPDAAKEKCYPIDGIVFKYDDCAYYNSLGNTDHHFRGGLAFKFYDEEYQTKLIDVEWSMGKTGVFTPIAIFEPVTINDTVVARASLHNINTMQSLYNGEWKNGLNICVTKSNLIIPQVTRVLDKEEGQLQVIAECPICGSPLVPEKAESGTITVTCHNPNCFGKMFYKLAHFCSKKGLDIKGLSEVTLSKLFERNWIKSYADIFELKRYEAEWKQLPGFGILSVNKIIAGIEEARNCTLENFLSSLSIPLIGFGVAKTIASKTKTYENFRNLIEEGFDFTSWSGFGEAYNNALHSFDYAEADYLAEHYLNIQGKEEKDNAHALENVIVCITGKLHHFKTRQQLADIIEDMGGKVTSSVSKKTTLLICDDPNSGTQKTTAAKTYNIPILSEDEFLEKYQIKGE